MAATKVCWISQGIGMPYPTIIPLNGINALLETIIPLIYSFIVGFHMSERLETRQKAQVCRISQGIGMPYPTIIPLNGINALLQTIIPLIFSFIVGFHMGERLETRQKAQVCWISQGLREPYPTIIP